MDEKLRKVVAETLGVDISEIGPSTSTESQPQWDSLRHMNLVFALEEAYGVRFRDDEIAGMTSIARIQAALGRGG